MTKNEIDNIIKSFKQWKVKGDKSFPLFLLNSRCFLSFSKDENQILNFIGKTDDKFYGIVLKLKINYQITNKYSSNADIESFSFYKYEREVLFFPYSTFCLENIYKGQFKGINCIIINLEYFGKYSKAYEDIKKYTNFKNSFTDTLNNQNYSKEIIESKIMLPMCSNINTAKKTIFDTIKNKMYEKYDIQIKDDESNKKEDDKKDNIPLENMICNKFRRENKY